MKYYFLALGTLFLVCVGCAFDGDSDVGGVQRRRVVDAVPHESHDIAAPL